MATTQRDYYEVLGVTRGVDEGEIKRAFRGLARELHPDVSEAPDAQERFREVVEAYAALSKRETRELYDRFGHAGLRGGGITPTQFDFGSLNDLFAAFFGDDLFGVGGRTSRSRGADLGVQVEIELVEAASGTKREIPFPVAVTCGTCGGSGAAPGASPAPCGNRGRADTERGGRARVPGGDAGRRDPGAPRTRDAGPAGLRSRRPARPGQRCRSAPAQRRAAQAARAVRALDRRGDLPGRRGILREAEERVPLIGLRRVSVTVDGEAAESARAEMLALFPEGFEEAERGDEFVLSAYTDAGGEARMSAVVGAVAAKDVPADWEERWKHFHRPVRAGRIWVVHPWERAPEDRESITIDPGRAFGTGAHPTTRLCLELVSELERGSLLDVSCGSGVLAIAAAKLGFAPVVGVDSDQHAIEAARADAAAHGFELEFRP